MSDELVKREREFAKAIAEQGEWLAKAHAEVERLRAALDDARLMVHQAHAAYRSSPDTCKFAKCRTLTAKLAR